MGYAHALALGADGTLYAWGSNSFGQLGTGDSKERSKPTPVAAFHGAAVVRIAAGQQSSYALTAAGCVGAALEPLHLETVHFPPSRACWRRLGSTHAPS
jgi:alpha-tubulin suppressor-like RCC1 family protein